MNVRDFTKRLPQPSSFGLPEDPSEDTTDFILSDIMIIHKIMATFHISCWLRHYVLHVYALISEQYVRQDILLIEIFCDLQSAD